MARRGRGSGSSRAKTATGGRGAATNGTVIDDVVEPGDEPGARTIGALALKRWVARGPGRGDGGDDTGDSLATFGPFDEGDLDREHAGAERVDFGAVQVPVPRGGEVSVEPEDGRLQAVHVMLPAGRLSVSALAAPRTEGLWPDLAAEIDESLREGGATVRSFTGEWGRELHARTGDASSLFVGVDGPRWMLYGVATGPTSSADELDVALRVMLRGTVVVRGRAPYPVRTVLPLTVPEQLPRPDRVPVPRMPADRVSAPRRVRPAPMADPPTTITPVADGVETVPYGIPRRAPGAVAGVDAPEGRGVGRPASPEAPAPVELSPAADDDTGAEPAVSRTASRGLFRRKPERPARPSNRPPQRRVADLIAEAERHRTAAEQPGSGTRRPVRGGGDDSGRAPGRPEPGRPTPPEHRSPNGHEANGVRPGEYVPSEPEYDRNGSLFGGSTAHDVPDRTTQFDASPLNEMLANGSPVEPPVNGSYANGSYPNGSYANGSSVNGSYVADFPADSHVESRADEAYGNGAYGSYRDEPSEPAWPSLGASGYVPPDDGWLLGYGSGSVAEPDLGFDDMPWAPAPTGFGGSHPSSALAADGSDDWTLPLPVIRAEPPVEPDPVRDPVGPPTRSRRARRAAEEPVPGAHSSERPRYAGHRAPDPTADHAGRASRRNGSSHARHAEEWDDIVGPVDRGRHRRPDH
jgi:Protein of unknown function (DUF3710)